MNTRKQNFGFKQNLLVIAMLAAFGPAQAADDEVTKLIQPDSTIVSVGAGAVAGSRADRAIFGQYTGWSENAAGLLLDFEYIQRNEETGTWMNAEGRNLGLDNRELSFSRQKQGAWKYSLDYSETVRHEPRSVNTGLQGAGTVAPTIATLATPGSGGNLNLDLKRRSYTLGAGDWLSSNFLVEATFKSEKKDGMRLAGVGGYCSNAIAGYRCGTTMGALLFVPEPTSATTNQVEVKGSLAGKGYNVTLGYYGSVYQNDLGALQLNPISGNLYSLGNMPFSAGSGANSLGGLLTQPVASAPDNQAHQMYLTGSYAITPTTRANFHFAKTRANQNDNFAASATPAGAGLPPNLDAAVDSRLYQVGLTARPISKLSLSANYRFEDIADQTPQVKYDGVFTNTPQTSSKVHAKGEVSYMLPENIRATLGADYAWVKRFVPAVGSTAVYFPSGSLTSVRETTDEVTYRAELRKSMSDTVNASLAYLESNRDGRHWLNIGATNTSYPKTYQPVLYSYIYSANGVFPTTMMDRKRDKVRAMVDWMASEALSLQFSFENGRDTYTAPTEAGLHSTGMRSVGVDGSYTVSDNWKVTGYANVGQQTLKQDQGAGYIADIKNTSNSVGFGAKGKVSEQIELGGDLSYLSDSNVYDLGSGNADAPGMLPDVTYRSVSLKLYGNYALNAQTDIRVDLVHQSVNFNEWTWANGGVPFAYADNSTVVMQPDQRATYLGVRYVYRIK
jgi:MtrB/PioB family decaheme-associated outer membrane protein